MFKFLGKMFDNNEKAIRAYHARVARINELEPEMKAKSDERAARSYRRTDRPARRGRNARRHSCRRRLRPCARRRGGRLDMRHFDVQLIGGIVLHEGKIAEMKTGEGKTLVATLPLYLNALTGEGATW